MSEKKSGTDASKQPIVERRGLLLFGAIATATTGASALSSLSAEQAQAAPSGDKNPASSYIPSSEKGAASGVATLDNGAKLPVEQMPDLSDRFAPRLLYGTLASRPSSPPPGTEWIQTDSDGGNSAGTRTYFDGAGWRTQVPMQIAQVGCQSNSWFTTMPDPNPHVSLMTFAAPGAGPHGVSLALFRLRKDITVASLALRKGTGAAPYSQAIYRLDGDALTRVATTGELSNPNQDNNIRRDVVQSVATLTAGTTYYYALTTGSGTFQYYQRTGGSIHTANMVGLLFGEATALCQSGQFHPAPLSIDTSSGAWMAWQNPPVHFGLAYT